VPEETTSRRDFLAASSAALASLWLTADPEQLRASLAHAAHAARSRMPLAWETFTPAQAADVDAIAAQIIPTDDTPGAREAHVVYFIDQALATFAKDDRPTFEKGYAAFRARAAKSYRANSFIALTSAQQIALLTTLEKEKSEFFEMMRGATIVGMLANPEYGGNYDKIGWKMIGFQDRFAWSPPFGWYDRDAR